MFDCPKRRNKVFSKVWLVSLKVLDLNFESNVREKAALGAVSIRMDFHHGLIEKREAFLITELRTDTVLQGFTYRTTYRELEREN